MDTQQVAAGQRIVIGNTTLVPIERTAASCRYTRGGVVGFGIKEVAAVVVLAPGGPRAYTVDGKEVPVETYAEYVPEIEGLFRGR